MTCTAADTVFCLRGADNEPEWFCLVGRKIFGPWPDKGSAMAGYQTELRRSKKGTDA